MRRAIAIAREAGKRDGAVPIGCVIVQDGQVVGEGANEVSDHNDPTAHAEIVAIRRATQKVGPSLRGATLYSHAAALRDVQHGLHLVARVAHRLQRGARSGS